MAPWESTYILVSHFLHGGVQLWDRFDQMNNAYFVLANGVYGVINVLTAFVFILFSPLMPYPAQGLYHTHVIVFYGLCALLRIIGGYALLRKFVSHKGVLFVSLLYLNTILTSYMMTPGIITQALYSFLPLLLYFILCFFEELRLKAFLMVVLVMALCFTCTPLFALGYFYQAVHFFILACLVAFVSRCGWRRPKDPSLSSTSERFKNIGLAACCALIVLPYVWWGKSLQQDFYVYGSGLGKTQGRFDNIFHLSGYFNIAGKSFANPLQFLGTSLDYHHNFWTGSWLFLGGSTLLLALAALVLSKDKRKHLFWVTILSIVLINTACYPENFFALGRSIHNALQDPHQILVHGLHAGQITTLIWLQLSSMAHGINFFTNPFSFLVRSFHMTSLLVSMFLLPLVAMGLDACLCLWRRNGQRIYAKRGWFLCFIYGFIALWAWGGGTQSLDVYYIGKSVQTLKPYILSLGTVFFVLAFMAQISPIRRPWLAWLILGFAFATDLTALKVYGLASDHINGKIMPTRISSSYSRLPQVPDYQNPYLLPVREFMDTHPSIPSDLGQCMFGAFYQYTPMGRFFLPWSIYEPRSRSYQGLYPDSRIQEYLKRNPRTMFFADYAFDSQSVNLSGIMHANLGQRAIVVQSQKQNKAFLQTSSHVKVSPLPNNDRVYQVVLDGRKAKKHKHPNDMEYVLDLPKNFPFYLSTSVFSADNGDWQLEAGGHRFMPMQGQLTEPFTYDVQNIQTKKLTIDMPQGVPLNYVTLQVKAPQGLMDVWKNTYDDFGFTYQAPRSGWLVFQAPYDKKWELIVDSHRAFMSRVNYYFMGAPITKGQHRILLRYWPHTTLRFWIALSMMISTIGFLGLMVHALKRQLPFEGLRS